VKTILTQYYQGIARQLRSEVDFINTLFEHQGIKGQGNEAALRELLVKFIPKRFGIGTGVVIDHHGNSSRQIDIVVFDLFLYPSLLALTSVHLFPVDIVYATIEVKTNLNSQSVKEALDNVSSVRSLDYIKAEFGDRWLDGSDIVVGFRKTTPPIGIVFAYNSEARQDETFKEWFTPQNELNAPFYPSLACSLDMGIVSFESVVEPGMTSATSVHPEIGMRTKCSTFPVVKKRDATIGDVKSTEDVQYLSIVSTTPSIPLVYSYEGNNYPIKKVGKDYMAMDQSRVLLVFLLQLADMLTHKKLHPEIRFMETYMQSLDKFHFVV